MTKKFNEDGRKKTPFLLKILLSIAAILVLLVAIWLLISYDAAVKTADPVNERISADPSSFGIDGGDQRQAAGRAVPQIPSKARGHDAAGGRYGCVKRS